MRWTSTKVMHIIVGYPPDNSFVIFNRIKEFFRKCREIENLFILTSWKDEDIIEPFRIRTVSPSIKVQIHVITYTFSIALDIIRVCSDIFNSEKGKIDVISAYDWMSCIPAIALKEFYGTPLILMLDSLEQIRGDMMSLLSINISELERHCINMANSIVALNKRVYEIVKSYREDVILLDRERITEIFKKVVSK